MSKKSTQAKKEERARRARAASRSKLMRRLPWYIVGVVGVGLISAFLFIGVSRGGGGGGSSTAAYPPGYTPPTLGSPDAPVEFVMWEDFQCPFCQRFELTTAGELEARFVDTGQLKFVWRNFQRYGSESIDSGISAYCAGEQDPDKFWEFRSTVFAHVNGIQTGALSRSNLQQFAEDLGLDLAAFNTCFDANGDRYTQIMAADFAMARSEGVTGTPTFFINGELIVGAQTTETFVGLIESALLDAARSEE